MLTYEDLKQEFKVAADPHDPWGSVLTWRFAVAGALYRRNAPIPDDWQYHPGLGAARDDSYEDRTCDEASTEALLRFGELLAKVADALRAADRDY